MARGCWRSSEPAFVGWGFTAGQDCSGVAEGSCEYQVACVNSVAVVSHLFMLMACMMRNSISTSFYNT